MIFIFITLFPVLYSVLDVVFGVCASVSEWVSESVCGGTKTGWMPAKRHAFQMPSTCFFFVFPFSSLMWPTIPQASFSVPRASVSASQIQLLISVWCLSHTKFKQKYLDTLNKYATHNSQFKRRVYYNICTELYMCCILEWNGARMENWCGTPAILVDCVCTQ